MENINKVNNSQINKVSKYLLSLVTVAALSLGSRAFGMDMDYAYKNMDYKYLKNQYENNKINIFKAIEENDCHAVEEIITSFCFNFNTLNSDGQTPLCFACAENKGYSSELFTSELFTKAPNFIKILLDKLRLGVNPFNMISSVNTHTDGDTALSWAVFNNNFKNVRFLLSNGAEKSVNIISKSCTEYEINKKYTMKVANTTPIYWAIFNRNIEIFELLLKYGADIKGFCASEDDKNYNIEGLLNKYELEDYIYVLKKYDNNYNKNNNDLESCIELIENDNNNNYYTINNSQTNNSDITITETEKEIMDVDQFLN